MGGVITEEIPAVRTAGPEGAVIVDLAKRRWLIFESGSQTWAFQVVGNGDGPFPSIESAEEWIRRRDRSGAAA